MPSKLRIFARNNLQYLDRFQRPPISSIIILNKLTICTDKIASTTQHITRINILHMTITYKILIQHLTIKYTLQCWVHIACITQILKPYFSSIFNILKFVFSLVNIIQTDNICYNCILFLKRLAYFLMLFMFCFALFWAEIYLLAFALLKFLGWLTL